LSVADLPGLNNSDGLPFKRIARFIEVPGVRAAPADPGKAGKARLR
jgi:hypothetical protein